VLASANVPLLAALSDCAPNRAPSWCLMEMPRRREAAPKPLGPPAEGRGDQARPLLSDASARINLLPEPITPLGRYPIIVPQRKRQENRPIRNHLPSSAPPQFQSQPAPSFGSFRAALATIYTRAGWRRCVRKRTCVLPPQLGSVAARGPMSSNNLWKLLRTLARFCDRMRGKARDRGSACAIQKLISRGVLVVTDARRSLAPENERPHHFAPG